MMLSTIVFALALGALLAGGAPGRGGALGVGLSSTIATLALAVGAAAIATLGDAPLSGLAIEFGPLGHAPLLALDGLAAPWVIATPLLALTVLAATPRRALGRGAIVATLATAAATETIFLSRNLALTAIAWALALAPALTLAWRDRGPTGRTLARTQLALAVGASVPMFALAVSLAQAGLDRGLASPLDVDALAALSLPAATQVLPLVLLLAGVGIRLGVVPFHAWLPPLLERGPAGVVAVLVGANTSVFLLARFGLPILPDASALVMPWVADLALGACVLGAFLGLAQTDLARMLAFLAGSRAAMSLTGIASLDASSLNGALLESVAGGVALTGVLLVVRGIEARTGSRDVRDLGGLVERAPRASAAFLVLSAAVVGFPGTLGFVGEDLLVHGVLDAHPIVAAALLLATALHAITLFRAYCRAFLGRPAGRPRNAGPAPLDDLLPRERVVTAGLVVLLIVLGLAPGPVLAARQHHVESLSGDRRVPHGASTATERPIVLSRAAPS